MASKRKDELSKSEIRQLRASLKALKEGKTVSWEEAKKRWGLK